MSTTAPFKPEAEALLRSKVEHLFSAKALPAKGAPFDLDVKSVRLGVDESWSPHIQSSITCALPDAEKLALLDARIGCRVQITTGYRYGKDDEESYLHADLHLRSRTIKHSSGEMTLELASDERLLMDHVTFGSEEVTRKDLLEFVHDVLTLTYPGFPFRLYSEFKDGAFAAEMKGDPVTVRSAGTELTPVLGKTAWTLIEEAQRRTGTWIYCQDGRNWIISQRAEITETPMLSLSIGENGTILDGESVLSRNGFYNEVVFRYEWTDDNLLPAEQYQIGLARVTGGPFSIHTIGQNTYVETIERRANKAEANGAAADKLSRLLTKGHEYTVRAVAAYWLRAGDTVALNIDGKTERLLVKSIDFDPAEGTMGLVLRKPEHATITTGI